MAKKESPSVAGGLLIFKPSQKLLSPDVGWTMGPISNKQNTAGVTRCHF